MLSSSSSSFFSSSRGKRNKKTDESFRLHALRKNNKEEATKNRTKRPSSSSNHSFLVRFTKKTKRLARMNSLPREEARRKRWFVEESRRKACNFSNQDCGNSRRANAWRLLFLIWTLPVGGLSSRQELYSEHLFLNRTTLAPLVAGTSCIETIFRGTLG